MFSVAWETRDEKTTPIFLFLACGYFWVAVLDLLHTLTFPEMNLLITGTTNKAAQFWIAARLFEASLLLLSVFVLNPVKRCGLLFILMGIIATISTLLIYSNMFPETYIPDTGLTDFKIYSEYLAIFMLMLAAFLLAKSERIFAHGEKPLLILAICLSILAEFSFTQYLLATDISNLLGHLLKLFSFWFLYQAVIVSNLKRPYSALKTSETRLHDAQKLSKIGHFTLEIQEGIVYLSKQLKKMLLVDSDDLHYDQLTSNFYHPDDLERVSQWMKSAIETKAEHLVTNTYRLINSKGNVIRVRVTGQFEFENDTAVRLFGTVQDITDDENIEVRAKRYINQTNMLFVSIDNTGRVIDINQKTSSILGKDSNQIIGKKWSDDFLNQDAKNEFNRFVNMLNKKMMSDTGGHENTLSDSQGHERIIDWQYNVERDAAGNLVELVEFGQDITAQKQAERAAELMARFPSENPGPVFRLDRSGNIIQANLAADNLFEMIGSLSENKRKDWGQFLKKSSEITSKTTEIYEVLGRAYNINIVPVEGENYTNLYGYDITEALEIKNRLEDITNNLPGAVFQYQLISDGNDKIIYMSNGCLDLWNITPKQAEDNPQLLWKVIHPDDIDGVMNSIQKSAQQMINWDYEWRIQLANEVKWLRGRGLPHKYENGTILWNTVVMDVTEQKNASYSINKALTSTVHVLAAALEARDPYTAGHEEQVTKISVLIAKKMKLDDDRIVGLELAGTIHDVGKIKVPAEILSKPTRLTEIEFALIKEHPVSGAEFIKNVNLKWPVYDIIRQHHERIDGSGYPDGLKGDEILLESRILAVADVLEAMASHRPYRAALGIEKAMEELRQGSGTRYDREVVNACLELIEEGHIVL